MSSQNGIATMLAGPTPPAHGTPDQLDRLDDPLVRQEIARALPFRQQPAGG